MAGYYPPGVSGNEPFLTGDYPCANCGATLPEQAPCEACEGSGRVRGSTAMKLAVCEDCDGSGVASFEGDTCPGGCAEPDWDAERDRREGF